MDKDPAAAEQLAEDRHWMERALELAQLGAEQGEVPVGAVVVLDGEVIGEGWNQPIGSQDPSAHAEVVAIRQAAQRVQNYRLPGATLYVTLEPCTMCTGAMVHSRISRLVYGTTEPKAGVVASQAQLLDSDWFNWAVEVQGGVLAERCSTQLSQFFAQRRALKKQRKQATSE
ncbi:tRNA adenosine(34) deaminase TadA [Motiliproteus coralliicola]|uniref:tRNA-specific adenosine deaminase n=1 Tax=Motiliproteus coralliicola TaxID=2283196 RepID=A0A369WG73_9GAMM|nr:tRNA adenosine(34) deaminase TadA [Motiliproteus coralliicola]RDE19606.1 tRNA adenosine(34) deaminase TadA [Motiliproteus coralliicola]